MRTLRICKSRILVFWCFWVITGVAIWSNAELVVQAKGDLWQKVKEKIPEVKEKATEVKEKATEAYDDATDAISDYRERSEDEFWDWFDSQTNGNGPQHETSEAESILEVEPEGTEIDTEGEDIIEVEAGDESETTTEVETTALLEADVTIGPDLETPSTEEVADDSSTIGLNRFEKAISAFGVGIIFWGVMLLLTIFLVTPVDASANDGDQTDTTGSDIGH